MTAPKCSDCAYFRSTPAGRWFSDEWKCGVPPKHRPLCADQRAPDGPCGPNAKLFAKREGA